MMTSTNIFDVFSFECDWAFKILSAKMSELSKQKGNLVGNSIVISNPKTNNIVTFRLNSYFMDLNCTRVGIFHYSNSFPKILNECAEWKIYIYYD